MMKMTADKETKSPCDSFDCIGRRLRRHNNRRQLAEMQKVKNHEATEAKDDDEA